MSVREEREAVIGHLCAPAREILDHLVKCHQAYADFLYLQINDCVYELRCSYTF